MTDDITKNLSDSEKLDFLINAVSDMNRRLAAVEERQTALEQLVHDAVSDTNRRLAALEQLVHDRLHDTRPIWQAVQQQLDRIESSMSRLEKQFKLMREDHFELRTDVASHEKRLDALEGPSQPS